MRQPFKHVLQRQLNNLNKCLWPHVTKQARSTVHVCYGCDWWLVDPRPRQKDRGKSEYQQWFYFYGEITSDWLYSAFFIFWIFSHEPIACVCIFFLNTLVTQTYKKWGFTWKWRPSSDLDMNQLGIFSETFPLSPDWMLVSTVVSASVRDQQSVEHLSV